MSKLATKADLLAEFRTQPRRFENHLAGRTLVEMCQIGVGGNRPVADWAALNTSSQSVWAITLIRNMKKAA